MWFRFTSMQKIVIFFLSSYHLQPPIEVITHESQTTMMRTAIICEMWKTSNRRIYVTLCKLHISIISKKANSCHYRRKHVRRANRHIPSVVAGCLERHKNRLKGKMLMCRISGAEVQHLSLLLWRLESTITMDLVAPIQGREVGEQEEKKASIQGSLEMRESKNGPQG